MSERLHIHMHSKSTADPLVSNQSKLLDKNRKPLVSRPPLIQAKLTINQPGDEYEQEADRVAEQVMRMPDPVLQRKCDECDEDGKRVLQAKESSGQMPATQDQDVPPIIHEVLRSPSQPLNKETRAFMEPRFGHDFSKVRVQLDEKAAESAQKMNFGTYSRDSIRRLTGIPYKLLAGLEQLSGIDLSVIRVHYNSAEPAKLNALAYTHDRNIHIAPGQEKYLPHESWHVVQQMQGRVMPTIQIKGVSLNDDDGLEHEADVMGARAHVMGEQIGAAGFHKHLEASVVGPKDEHLVVATTSAVQSIPSQLVKPMIRTRNVSVIQKVANFVDGSEYATKNLAEDFLNENMRGGQTELTLNGMIIMSAEETRAALKVPELGWNTKADGTVDAWVERVPTNVFSFKMHLPSIAPWIKVTTKARVSELMTKHQYQAPAGCNIPGNSTFRLNGKPSDANLATNIRTHEYLHVSDFKQGFNSFIIPWDTKLEQAKAASTKFNGATIVAAKAALFASMGGTPEQIATAFDNEMERRLRVTHANRTTATGGGPTGTNFVANATCTESSADFM